MESKQRKVLSLVLGLAVIFGVLIFNSWMLNSNFTTVREQQYWVSHTYQAISALDGIISAAKDTETGVRGYLLTEQDAFLEPYRFGTADIDKNFNRFIELTKDNQEQQANSVDLKSLLDRRVDTLDRLKATIDSRSLEQRRILIAQGKTVMDDLRAQADKMKDSETALLNRRKEAAEKSENLFFIVLVITTALSGAVVAIAFWQIRKGQIKADADTAEQTKQAWIKESVSEVARATSGDISLTRASGDVQNVLTDRFGVLASRLFLYVRHQLTPIGVNGEEDRRAVERPDSLINQALAKGGVWQITDVPEDHWKISSGLGASRPRVLVFVPFSFQGRKLGVLELGTYVPLNEMQLEALGHLSETLAVGLNAVQSREHLQELFEETQQQAEELQAQQEELKSNNEELEQQARALESQQQTLNLKNRELEATHSQLEQRAEDLQRSSQYKSEFLAKMSHELRTPLNGILILSSLLNENKDHNLSEQQKQFAKSIHTAGNDLLMLINDILDLSKIEARKLSLRPEEFTVESLFSQIAQTFAPQAESKGLAFEVKTEGPDAKKILKTDRQRLEQILRNFLSNAIKFTDKGSITISARIDDVKKIVSFTVQDTGIGVPKEKLGLIFEAFEQADGTVSRRFGGTGLGLTISRELAGLLGGDIAVESIEGQGSRFTLTVPTEIKGGALVEDNRPISTTLPSAVARAPEKRNDGQKQNVETQAAAAKAIANLDKDKKSILIVEDDRAFAMVVGETVKSSGSQPIIAEDGEIALAILENHIPDAILLDIKLPGISGLGVLEIIKQLPHLRHIPVHMISALDYQHNALRRGALGYLTKPVTVEKIKSALDRISNMIADRVRKVLIIEDDEHQGDAISHLIAGEDVKVTLAKNGKQAVSLLKEGAFDCIILDLTLPDVSGFDLLNELNSLHISLPPVVIYTGKDLSPDEEAYLRKFSESIIIKGARSPERLLDEVNLFLHRVESLLPQEQKEMLSNLRSQESSFSGKTVLVVDDDIRNIFALTSALESKSLKVKTARNGFEALDSLAQNPDIDCVLMDIMMPKMDGFEAMRRIRTNQNPRIKKVPIIALTAKAMREDHEKCIEAGANDYLPKPINLDNLMTTLKVWLSNQGIFE